MDPIAYNLVNPADAIMSGLKTGASLDAIAAQRQQQVAAQQQAAQMQADLQSLYANPNAGHAEYAAVMTKYPGMAENIGKAFKVLDEGRQRTAVEFGSRVYGALQSGNTALAIDLMRQRAKADPRDAQTMQMLSGVAENDPAAAKLMWASTLAGMLGPDKFAEGFAKLGAEQRAQDKAPAELVKAQADAKTAVADATIKTEQAKVAPQAVLLDLEKKGWDIKKIKADIEIAREDNRIKAMNAAISRETNDLKRQELRLKLQETEDKIADKMRERVATAENGAASIDNMLNTIERIKTNKSLDAVLGSIEGRSYYPNATLGTLNPLGNGDERADAIALIETLGSQAFLAQIPNIKGMGSLSNAEGEKLQAALQNLSRVQSEKQFRDNLDEAARLLKKGRENLSRSTGVPLPKPDTPAAPGARPPLSSFAKS